MVAGGLLYGEGEEILAPATWETGGNLKGCSGFFGGLLVFIGVLWCFIGFYWGFMVFY